MLAATGDNVLTRVPVGADGQVLTADAAISNGVKWAPVAGGGGSTDLVYNGDFPTNTPYTDGDIVISNGVAYMCVRPTAAAPTPWPGGGGNPPDLVKYWGDYSASQTYMDGDVVVGPDGFTYMCCVDGTVGVAPVPFPLTAPSPATTKWVPLGTGTGTGVPLPVVNGQWLKGVGGAAVWSAISAGDVAGIAANNLGINASGATTDLASPTAVVNYYTITTGGGAVRSIGTPAFGGGSRITLKNASAAPVALRHAIAGGSGKTLSIIGLADKLLAVGQSNEFVYDGTNWQEINRPGMELITDFVVSGSNSPIDFTNIPACYKNLFIEGIIRGDAAAAVDAPFVRFNADTGSNYGTQVAAASVGTIGGSYAAPGTYGFGGTPTVSTIYGNTSAAAGYSLFVMDVPYFLSAANKVAVFQAWQMQTPQASTTTIQWQNVAPINRITLGGIGAGNFVVGSRLTLYGIS